MNKQPEITEATRESFVSAFFELAQVKEIHQITIREITKLAGYNRTTFYRYFEDIYALIEYAEDDFFQTTRRIMRERNGGNGVHDRQFFETFIRCFQDNPDRVAVLMSEQNRFHFIRRMRENVIDHIGRSITDTPKKKAVTDMFFYGIFSAIAIHMQSREALPDEDLLEIIQKLFNDWYWPQVTEEGVL
ncbi:MAG: TetR/AcrR family transcriptional regulator [Clostridiales bacterium]|nr:TetR/AcrR family transcriptional regulator [Clostridiales bacterium]